MNILDNELVKKYFRCFIEYNHPEHVCEAQCRIDMGYKVLQAMQEPIKEGERVLIWHLKKNTVEEYIFEPVTIIDVFENYLRIPDKFQTKPEKRECDCHCHKFGDLTPNKYCCEPNRDEIKCIHGLSYCIQCKTAGKWQIKDEVEERIIKEFSEYLGWAPVGAGGGRVNENTEKCERLLRELIQLVRKGK